MALGPEPFKFEPHSEVVEGPAFSRWFQAVTWLTVLGSGYWLLHLWQQGKFGGDASLVGLKQAGWFILAWLLLAWTAWHVVSSRMRLDTQGLHQTWIWHKTMAYDDLAYAKLIRVRGLEWFVAPRFYVRTLMGKFAVFYVSDAVLLAECERLQQALKDFRQL
jgi:hypothetical protein